MKVTGWLPVLAVLGISATTMADDPEPQRDREVRRDVGARELSGVHANVVPAIAGIEAADKAVAVLYELAGGEGLRQKDAQDTVALARQALDMALDRAAALDNVRGLSRDARTQLDRATRSLRQARTTLRRIDEQVGNRQARVPLDRAQRLRDQAGSMHEDLSDAEDSIERIAKAYDVPTDLEFGD